MSDHVLNQNHHATRVMERGLIRLQNVIACLRETGHYEDEEGPDTDDLADLHDVLVAAQIPQALPEGFGSEPGQSQCRDEFEQWYTTHAFDLQASPIGSRDCMLQWSAWMQASVKYAAAQAPAPIDLHAIPVVAFGWENTMIGKSGLMMVRLDPGFYPDLPSKLVRLADVRAALAAAQAPSPQHIIAEFLERTGQYVTNDASREAAIAEAIAAAVPSGWKLIATAPKDSPLWLFSPDLVDADFCPAGVVDGHWQDDVGWMGAVWSGYQDEWHTSEIKPTHWMMPWSPAMPRPELPAPSEPDDTPLETGEGDAR